MTVSSSTSDTRYAGNGSTTVFASGFTFYDASTLRVSLVNTTTGVETVKVLTTDYTVTGGAGATGSITFIVAPPTGNTVVIQRIEPYSQLTSLGANDPLPAAVLELTYDKLEMQLQQIYRRTLTAIQSPAGFDPNTAAPYTMPTPSNGMVLVGNATNTGWSNSAILTLVGVLSVVTTSLADRDLLEYDNAGGVWRNQTSATVLGRVLTTRGDVLVRGASAPQRLAVGAANTFLQSNGTDVSWGATPVPRSYLAGLALSAAGATATFGIAAGQAADGGNASMMTLAAATTKTTAAWAVGSAVGSLDTGAIAANTFYHVWLIQRPDTGVVDVLTSLSATAPTMPANYTLKRRIGSMKTDGSSNWIAFTQIGDEFLWLAPPTDVSAAVVNATQTLFALSVPSGVAVKAKLRALGIGGVTTYAIYSPSQNAETVTNQGAGANLIAVSATSGNSAAGNYEIWTSTGQIAVVAQAVTGNNFTVVTDGWIDRRGRDS